MRTGLSTIQQTLTLEAASVLNRSISDAARRNHGQTTPLHVAAALLASPTGILRQACARSHPDSPHPLQCRALELCFSVALDRLPSAPTSSPAPPISNALMAALKRAQAHQRRGCPEQQQQPLLAVKVELEQLVVSILDDPSVSRVMREASFSSPAVKATIEQSTTTTTIPVATNNGSSALGQLGMRPVVTPTIASNRCSYISPRFQQQQQPRGEEEVRKVLDILARAKKRNPVLVGDSEPGVLMKEVLKRIESGGGRVLIGNVHVVSVEEEFLSDRSLIPKKIIELGNSIDAHLNGSNGGGVILDLGDLKWLVESPNCSSQIRQQQLVSEVGKAAVTEMAKLLGRFENGGDSGLGSGKVWVISTASCATYLRCQVYHPAMENDWDLQALPIAPRALNSTMFPRTVGNGILSSYVESLTGPAKSFSPPMAVTIPLTRCKPQLTDIPKKSMCHVCKESYERQLAMLVAMECEKSSSDSKPEERQPLPQWLQAAKVSNGAAKSTTLHQLQTKEHEMKWKEKTEELLNHWNKTCSRLHPSSSMLLGQPFKCKPTLARSFSPIQVNTSRNQPMLISPPEQGVSPARSPVRTELVLGWPPTCETINIEQSHQDRIPDLGGCKLDFFSIKQQKDRIGGSNLDADFFKKLFKGLTEAVAWQQEAASSVAVSVMQCRFGNRKRRATGTRTDTWLLFMGPDKMGKKKMALALSNLLFGTNPVTISLSGASCGANCEDRQSNMRSRGKTALDRVIEAVQRNPFSIFVLENVDQADTLVQGSIKRAIERGRLPDSHGREVSLGNAVLILSVESLPESLKASAVDSLVHSEEEKLEATAKCGWQLELLVGEKVMIGKRRAEWKCEEDRPTKPRKEPGLGLSLDLNLAAGVADEDGGEGSRNSSDVTVEHEHEYGRLAIKQQPSQALPSELIAAVDDAVVFKPVDFSPIRRKISDAIATKFTSILGSNGPMLQVDSEALDRMVGGLWFGNESVDKFDDWMDGVLASGFWQLKTDLAENPSTVKLVVVKDKCLLTSHSLPTRLTVSGRGTP